jgi:hypothetical protein
MGRWLRIHDHLHEEVRRQMEREAQPAAAVIDSQSVQTLLIQDVGDLFSKVHHIGQQF